MSILIVAVEAFVRNVRRLPLFMSTCHEAETRRNEGEHINASTPRVSSIQKPCHERQIKPSQKETRGIEVLHMKPCFSLAHTHALVLFGMFVPICQRLERLDQSHG